MIKHCISTGLLEVAVTSLLVKWVDVLIAAAELSTLTEQNGCE